MIVNLGENIRRMRGERNLTQEQLAFDLGVSPQALSRWETGSAMPAISTLFDIADFFDVTLDELTGRNIECPSDELNELIQRTTDLQSNGKPGEAITLAREIAEKYPRDEYALMLLANQLYTSSLDTEIRNYDDEIIELCEKVRHLGKHPDMWVMATERLVKLYIRSGQQSRAHTLAGRLPSLFCGREIAVRNSLSDGKNKLDCCLNNIIIFHRLLENELSIAASLSDPNNRIALNSAEEKISDIFKMLNM